MIAASVVEEIRRLLVEGKLSQRKIARLTGISRGTVGAIAAGRRPDYESLRSVADGGFPGPAGPPQRCPGCGGMVYMPCRLCRARAVQADASNPRLPGRCRQLEEPLGLELRDEDRARYEEICRQRVSALAAEDAGGMTQRSEGPQKERDDLCGVFEVEEDEWGLDPADLWDALGWEDEDAAIDVVDAPDLDVLCRAAEDELSPQDST